MANNETAIFSGAKRKKSPENLLDYIKLCFPILLFPLLYFPYDMWWRQGFASIASDMLRSSSISILRLLVIGNNTVLLFWICVTTLVMAVSVVVMLTKISKWYAAALYIAVMFSLCGICSLWFYTLII